MSRPTPRWKTLALLGLCVLASLPTSLAAQMSPRPRARQPRPDFLFGAPSVTFSIRAGYALPTASSQIFDQTERDLTVSHRDFYSPSVSGELAVRATERLDVVADFGYAGSNIRSEFRDWLDNNDLPIEQTTKFTRRPLTLGLKWYLRDRGREISHLAWIPDKWTPFLGIGTGWVWYTFEQKGDFVDFQTLDVFPDRFVSSGKAGTVSTFGGADWSLGPHFLLTAEGRYSWARTPMEQDFQGFNKIDLSGFQASAGISLRF